MTKFVFLSVFVIVGFASVCRADDPTPAKVLEEFQDYKKAQIDKMQSELAQQQKRLAKAQQQRDRNSVRQIAAEIRGKKTAIAALQKSKELPIPELRNLKVGSIGHLAASVVKVLQVLGPNEMLVTYGQRFIPKYVSTDEAVEAGSAEAQKIADNFKDSQNAIPEITLRVEAPTMNITDDTRVNLQDLAECWQIYKTTTYQSAAGTSKTVLVARPYDLTAVKKLWAEKQK